MSKLDYKLSHVVESQQFSREILEHIFDESNKIERSLKRDMRGSVNCLRGFVMATLFYEPSTRTRLSFESAMLRLGGSVISTDNAREFSSVSKGETLEDTIKVVQSYCDVIVLRHHETGAAVRAMGVSGVPIINAGDGAGQHPTQSLIDLYTIKKEIGHIDGLKIAMVGDLANGRTVRSLCYLLSKYNKVKIYFVSPEAVGMKDDILQHLKNTQTEYIIENDLTKVLPEVDVVYQTRIQKERFEDITLYESVRGKYILDKATLSKMKERSIIMHPLPRLDEISKDVDADKRAAYFRQAGNGIYVRGAILTYLLT